MLRDEGGALSGVRVHDAETAMEAVLAGLGRTLLPTLVAAGDARLRQLTPTHGVPLPAREIWLLSHAGQARLRRTAVVAEWVDSIFAARAA